MGLGGRVCLVGWGWKREVPGGRVAEARRELMDYVTESENLTELVDCFWRGYGQQ